MKCTLTLLLLWVLPATLAFQQSNDATTGQNVTNSEQQSRYRIAQQNEADSISSQPAEEHQDSADNTSPQLVAEPKDMADILFQPMTERQYMADIALQPVKDDENEALRPLYQTVGEDQSKADKTSHPQKDRNETLRWSHQDVWEIQNEDAEMPRQNVEQDYNKTDMMCNHTQHQPRKGNQNETLRIPHLMTKQEGSQTIRLKPYPEGAYRRTDAMLSHMARTLDMLGNSFNHSKSRWRRDLSALSNEPCKCRECSTVSHQTQANTKRVNVAFNKEAKSSSIKPKGLPACAVVDGRDGTRSNFPKTCFSSADSDKQPWWTVDLGGVYTFKEILFTWPLAKEQYISNTDTGRRARYQFAAYSLTVDGSTCWRTSNYKFHYKTSDSNTGINYDFRTCQYVRTGRYIRLTKRSGSDSQSYYRIKLCEMKIWVCEPGFYFKGPSCVPCGSTCPFRCDNYYGCTKKVDWNAAIHRPTYVSSVKYGSGAYVVDGVGDSVSVTQCFASDPDIDGNKRRWWTVDFGGLFKIVSVRIHLRVDCCGERLTNFLVLIYRQRFSITKQFTPPKEIWCQKQKFKGKLFSGSRATMACSEEIKGRFLTILKDPPEPLELCEVQAFGYSYRVLDYGEVCGQNSITECPDDSTCTGLQNQKKTCRKLLGTDCKNSAECIPGGVICDAGGKCALDLYQKCTDHRTNCRSGALCDEKSGLICKSTIGGLCNKTDDCTGDTVCDDIKICKNAVNHVCSSSATCVAGAICDQKTKTCKCDAPATPNGKLCKATNGQAGSPCKLPSNPCKVSNSSCSSETAIGKCVCVSGWQADTDFTCKSKPGTTCSVSKECITSICEGGTCILKKGQSCKNLNFCGADGICDTGDVCKIKPGKSCKNEPDMCKTGSFCSDGVCKVKLSYECDSTSYCAGGAMCAQNLRSKTVKVCSLSAGQPCFGHKSSLCVVGTVCTSDGVCKLELGQPCNPANSHCIPPTAKCDPSTRKCKLVLGATCKVDDDCHVGTTCDNIKQCKLIKDAACTDRPNMCLVGSTCTGGKCTCISGSTKTDTKKCDPANTKAGGACSHICGDDFTVCINGICKCTGNFVTLSDYTCGAGPGALCTNSSYHCVAGTICDVTGVCHLDVGESCMGPKRSLCKIGTVCDKHGVCKLQLHGDCSRDRDMCATGTQCDAAGRCKIGRGSFCRDDKVCVAGATCQKAKDNSTGQCTCTSGISKANGSICVPDAGRATGKCLPSSTCKAELNVQCNSSAGICNCKAGVVLEEKDFSCKLGVGKSCAGSEEKCKSGMTCDTVSNECRIKIGEFCDPKSPESCVTGSICDSYGICKLGLNGNCRSANLGFCKTGTFCDLTGRCRLGSGTTCDSSKGTVCVAGADCQDYTCVCNADITTVVGVMCAPVAGRANAACNDVDMPCTVPHSACVDGICVCNDNQPPNHDFACPNPEGTDDRKDYILWLVVATLAALVVLSGCAYIFYKKRQRSEAAKIELRQQRAASLAELRKLSTDPELSEQPESSAYSETNGANSEASSSHGDVN